MGTEEEVEQANAVLLTQQIAKLEAHAARRQAGSKVVSHYQSVPSTLRSTEASTRSKLKHKFSHRRVRSEPTAVLVAEVETAGRCRANSDWLLTVPEESAAEFENDMLRSNRDEGSPVVCVVRSCQAWTHSSMSQLNAGLHCSEAQ